MPSWRASCIDGPADARDFGSNLDNGRVRSCIRPVSATDVMAAGPDGDRGSRPHQRVALVALKALRACSIPAPPVSIMLSFALHHKVAWTRGSSGRELRPIEFPGRHHRPDNPG
jgi:hypothetical protein